MSVTIAVAGKGGVGKTTLCGLLIQYLCETGRRPVLAVDADANSNLNEVLGVEVDMTLGEIREEVARAKRIRFLQACQSPIIWRLCLTDAWLKMMISICSLWEEPRVKDAIVSLMDCCRHSFRSLHQIIHML